MMNRGSSAVAKELKRLSKGRQKQEFQQTIIRREQPVAKLKEDLDKLPTASKQRKQVVYASPAVDVAASLPLVKETVELTKLILDQTNWDVRLLSKSPLITKVAEQIPTQWKNRVIYGVSTGTLEDQVARAIEPDAPAPSNRLAALKHLQQRGHRTFAMLCPILPQDLVAFIATARSRINFDDCEAVWAEVLNRRGRSMAKTHAALKQAGLSEWAHRLQCVYGAGSSQRWEAYARSTFAALTTIIPPTKLNFLQYITPDSLSWWRSQKVSGAIPLGKISHVLSETEKKPSAIGLVKKATPSLPTSSQTKQAPLSPAKKAWKTMREKYTTEEISERARKAAQKAAVTRARKANRKRS